MAEATEPTARVVRPQPGPQTTFLASAADIAVYGGAAGGGKTWALLMEPLRHVHNGDFGAVFFRRTTPQIRNEGGLWDESNKLYPMLGAEPREHVLDWRFPSGASVSFAHLEYDKTRLQYQGAQIPLICFDELTHFTPEQFWYLVSRNRSMCGVRPYIRATCNPEADSWVAELIAWWIDPETGLAIPERGGVLRWFVRINDELVWGDSPEELAGHINPATGEPIPPKSLTFVPAKLTDNLALMKADPGYMASLMALPTVERERLLGGNWKIKNTRALVFTNWLVQAFETPADAVLRFGADWGFANDPTVLVRGFVEGRRIYVDHEAAGVGVEIDDTPALFGGTDDREPARWDNRHGHPGVPGATKWAITADSARPETVSYMRRKGFRVIPAIKGPGSIEDGVAFLQSYEIVVHPRCKLTAQELSRYSYKIDKDTGAVLPLLEDKDNNCLVAGTLVSTQRGRIPIERVKAGDYALTRAGYRRITFSGVTGSNREVVKVDTTIGVFICTPDHRVFTTRGLVRADALRYDDEVIGEQEWSSDGSGMAGYTGVIRRAGERLIATISAAWAGGGRFSFTATCGSTITALYPRDSTSITRMAIQAITTSPISNAFCPPTTVPSIHTQQIAAPLRQSIWTAFATSPRLGTQARKGARSIGKSARLLIKGLSLLIAAANNAGKSFAPENWDILTGSARMHASPHGGGQAASMMLSEPAPRADRFIAPTDTRRRKHVRGRVLTVSAGGVATKVYDLTVEGEHEFFANGVLVSNCIDALRYALEALRRAPKTRLEEPAKPRRAYQKKRPKASAWAA